MKINGKEIKFEYTIGAMCDYNDHIAKNPNISLARAQVYEALYMNRAYTQAHGGDEVTLEEIMSLPGSMYHNLMEEVKAAKDEGNERSVEAVEKKQNVNRRK